MKNQSNKKHVKGCVLDYPHEHCVVRGTGGRDGSKIVRPPATGGDGSKEFPVGWGEGFSEWLHSSVPENRGIKMVYGRSEEELLAYIRTVEREARGQERLEVLKEILAVTKSVHYGRMHILQDYLVVQIEK